MDQKNWLWRKRSSEKRIIENEKSDLSVKENGEESVQDQSIQSEKEKDLEETVSSLNEKLKSALEDCNAKDELITKMAEESEAEITRLKGELEEAMNQREASNERLAHLNIALKDCMQKATITREETERKVREAVMRTSEELEKAHKMLEEKLTEASKKAKNLTIENSRLGVIIEDLTKSNAQAEAEFNAAMSRLDSTEKENAFLRYESQMLERELRSRNEEVLYIRRSAEASQRQQLENVKKIKRLEAECQRLRVLVRKRMPGQSQALLANMKKEVENEVRRKDDSDIIRKEMNFLVECLCKAEEENKNLKSVLARKVTDSPLPITAPKTPNDIASISSRESFSSESWASALISELEHFKNHKNQRKISDHKEMRLMDDFAEMEKLAIIAVDEDSTGKDLVAAVDDRGWVERVLKMVIEQSSVSKKSFYELLEEIKTSWDEKSVSSTQPISGYLTWKSPVTSPKAGSMEEKIIELQAKNEGLRADLERSKQKVESLQSEVESLRESKRMMEDMIENQKSMNEELDTQLTVTKSKLNESLQKMSSLEVELEDKSQCCEDLEGTCLELQLQLESINSQTIQEQDMDKERQIQQTGWEITAASMKLAECQETILNLGKQLKALTLSEEELAGDKQLCPSDSNDKTLKKHVSLLDQMQFEDEDGTKSPKKEETKEETLPTGQANTCRAICTFKGTPSGAYIGSNNGSKNAKSGALVVLPGKKQGVGIRFLRKLLLRRKRGDKRTSYSIAA